MAIYRNIHTSFWDDTKVIDDMTPEDRYFMLYLLTNPHTNLIGCYEISIKQISDEIGYVQDQILNLLNRLQDTHKIIGYCRETKEVWIKNWYKYNWTKSSKLHQPIIKQVSEIKNLSFKRELIKTCLLCGIDTVSIPYPYPMDTTDSDSDSDSDKEGGTGETKKPRKPRKPKEEKPKEEKIKYADDVFMTETEYKKLVDKYGEAFTKQCVEKLSNAKGAKGYKYQSDYKAILTWVLNAVKESNEKTRGSPKTGKDFQQRTYTPEHFEKDRIESDEILNGFYEKEV